MMSDSEYNFYRLNVLAKCSGAHVHRANGLLGRVGRIIFAVQRGIIQLPEDLEAQQVLYNETIQEIGKLTQCFP